MGERVAHVTDFDSVPHEKPLPLESQIDRHSGIVGRDDSATGNIVFMEKNAKLDAEYALPGSGSNSNGSWVRHNALQAKNNLCRGLVACCINIACCDRAWAGLQEICMLLPLRRKKCESAHL